MIIREYPKKSNLHNFFIFEADGDDAKVTTTTVTASNDDQTDYTDDVDESEPTSEPVEVSADDNETTDYTTDENDNYDESNEDDSGATDYTSDEESETDDTEEANDENVNVYDTAPEETVQDESTKRYNLFRELIYLYNSNKSFISKLENIVRDDIEGNSIVNITVNKLRDVEEIMFEFMTIKFMNSTYIEALTFYESILAVIKLNFQILKNNEPYLKQ